MVYILIVVLAARIPDLKNDILSLNALNIAIICASIPNDLSFQVSQGSLKNFLNSNISKMHCLPHTKIKSM